MTTVYGSFHEPLEHAGEPCPECAGALYRRDATSNLLFAMAVGFLANDDERKRFDAVTSVACEDCGLRFWARKVAVAA